MKLKTKIGLFGNKKTNDRKKGRTNEQKIKKEEESKWKKSNK
jgi:hypothetical protein